MTQSIVLNVCQQLRIHPAEFFGNGRDRRLSKARRVAIKKLKEAGFNNKAIARLIRRNYSTVQYWTHLEYRERRRSYYRNLRAAQKGAESQPQGCHDQS
jgi:hypothetical protein